MREDIISMALEAGVISCGQTDPEERDAVARFSAMIEAAAVATLYAEKSELKAQLARLTTKALIADTREKELKAEVERLKAACTDERMCVACFTGQGHCSIAPPAAAVSEPVKYLANGMRFKTAEFPYGVCINGLPKELAGRWVALVAAENDMHLKATQPAADTKEPT